MGLFLDMLIFIYLVCSDREEISLEVCVWECWVISGLYGRKDEFYIERVLREESLGLSFSINGNIEGEEKEWNLL